MSQLLPEQPESAASPDTRAIYAELRRLCGVPMVPLIYRHLATIPGGLEWAWSLLGPALRTGRLQESAWIISRSVQLEPAVKLPAEALQILGVTTADLAEFHKLLAAYNRSNPVNLLGLRSLALFAQRDPQPQVDRLPQIDRVTPWQAPEPVRDLLPMVDPATIQGDARALMVLLNDRGDASRASPSGLVCTGTLHRAHRSWLCRRWWCRLLFGQSMKRPMPFNARQENGQRHLSMRSMWRKVCRDRRASSGKRSSAQSICLPNGYPN